MLKAQPEVWGSKLVGKTKTKIMDDSIQVEKVKKPAKKLGRTDELVEKLKAELGVDQKDSEKLSKPEDLISGKSDVSETTGKLSPSEKKSQASSKIKPRSKRYQETVKDLDRNKTYPLNEAVELVKKHSLTKFTGSLEAHILVVQAGLRGLVSLPYASGKTEYKTESKAPVIHLGLGKLNQPTEELSANIKTLLQTLGKSRIKQVRLAPTMGPSVKLDITGY